MKGLDMDFSHDSTLYFIFKIYNIGKICIVHSIYQISENDSFYSSQKSLTINR